MLGWGDRKQWNLKRFFETPEVKLKRNFKQNPIFPFHETEDEFVLEVRNEGLYTGLVMFLISGISGAIYWYEMKRFSNEVFDTGFTLFFLWSLRMIYFNIHKRRICIEKDGQRYFFFVGGRLVFEGDVHNIYLRLRGQKSSNGNFYYRLVLNGFHVEEQEITSMSTNKTELENLAKKLAFKININYFDSEDVSNRHIVRHVNPKTFYMKPSLKHKVIGRAKRVSVTRATLDAFY